VFLNLFIAIILEGFAESKAMELMTVNEAMVEEF
jgi:hypothetical protein